MNESEWNTIVDSSSARLTRDGHLNRLLGKTHPSRVFVVVILDEDGSDATCIPFEDRAQLHKNEPAVLAAIESLHAAGAMPVVFHGWGRFCVVGLAYRKPPAAAGGGVN